MLSLTDMDTEQWPPSSVDIDEWHLSSLPNKHKTASRVSVYTHLKTTDSTCLLIHLRRQMPLVCPLKTWDAPCVSTKDDRCVPCYAHRGWRTWQCRYEGGDSGYGLHQQRSVSETEVRTAPPLQSARKHRVLIRTSIHICLQPWELLFLNAFSVCLCWRTIVIIEIGISKAQILTNLWVVLFWFYRKKGKRRGKE